MSATSLTKQLEILRPSTPSGFYFFSSPFGPSENTAHTATMD